MVVHRALGDDLAVGERGDAVADGCRLSRSWVTMKTVRPSVCCSVADQRVEFAGGDRIEPGGRLVEKNDLRIERQRARQRRRAWSCRRTARRDTCRRPSPVSPTISSLASASSSSSRCERSRYSRIGNWTFWRDGERREQRALLEQDAPAPLDRRAARCRSTRSEVDGRTLRIVAWRLGMRPMMRAQEHRFAAARAADEAEDLAAPHVEREMVEHDAARRSRPRDRGPG